MSVGDRRTIDRAFANVGKAIAAYERLLQPGESRFDRYVQGLRNGRATDEFTEEEVRGLALFVDSGRTLCLRCHNGPLFTNQAFHDVGTGRPTGQGGLPDFGRFLGIQAVVVDPFNCRGSFSDAAENECGELRFLDTSRAALETGKFKTPTLRGVARTGPYMHDGRMATLEEVIEHYRRPAVAGRVSPELTPLEIDAAESRALVAFLATLDGGIAAEASWLRPPEPGRP
jgi:cytochrome c peroxidase